MKNTKVTEKTLYICSAAFLPNIFLFYLYNNNKDMNNIRFIHTIMLAAVFALISVGLLFSLCRVERSKEGALLTTLVFWCIFWFFESIYSIATRYSVRFTRTMLLFCYIAIIVAIILVLRQYHQHLRNCHQVFAVLGLIICIMFGYNFIPNIYYEFVIVNKGSVDNAYEIKVDFFVDDSLPSPDVYWFHMEEMMNFVTIEKYFGDSLEELKSDLFDRGFVLNEDATLLGGFTRVSVPELMSPDFNDSYLHTRIVEVEKLTRKPRERELNRIFAIDNVDIAEDIATQYELFRAFMADGYTAITIENQIASFPLYNVQYRIGNDEYPLMVKEDSKINKLFVELGDTIELLTSTTPISVIEGTITRIVNRLTSNSWTAIPEHEEEVNKIAENTLDIREERRIYRRLFDSFDIQSPKFVFIVNTIAHDPYDRIYKTGKVENQFPDNPNAFDLLYLPQFKYAAEVMLRTVDMVLEQNPDAVIVIQADHGPHSNGQYYMIDQGYPESQILEMNYSVFSAVRIPPQYGVLDEPLDPLNITRYLVNNFVGENYEMLDIPAGGE